jgi:hypothetical protein
MAPRPGARLTAAQSDARAGEVIARVIVTVGE